MDRTVVVVTGGGRGVGRAIVERLVTSPHRCAVIVELDPSALDWIEDHPARDRLDYTIGDAADGATTEAAADAAQSTGHLRGWVNNAAVFRDIDLHTAGAQGVIELIGVNLNPTIVGSATAVQRFLAQPSGGSIVNVSSHQAARPVRGALTYATAKAGIEGFTRALAVEYGPHGIRTNAVALGSIVTDRLQRQLEAEDSTLVHTLAEQLQRLHPLRRPGTVEEVATTVSFLLSEDASFINGAVIPVDGGRSVLGLDPESRD